MRARTGIRGLSALLGLSCWAATASGAFIIQVDTDGSSIGTTGSLNPLVTFGNGTTNHGGFSIAATAAGLAPGNSIFGGNAPVADQYIFTYTPGVHADNFIPTAGTALGNGNTASGEVGGSSGMYNVFVCWPNTANISDNGAVPTSYVLDSDLGPVTVGINQDEDTNGSLLGGVWAYAGTVQLTAGNSYAVTQTAPNTLFVSMRAAAVMWEPVAVPEPAALSLVTFAGLSLRRRR